MRDDNSTRSQAPRRLSAIALEQRMLLDGAAVATAIDAAADAQHDAALAVERAALDSASLSSGTQATDAVFIDTRVTNYQALLAGVPASAEVFFLDASSNGLNQITAALAGGQTYRSIQIYSHGANGQVALGNIVLDRGNVDNYGDALATIGQSLTADGDLLIFGCDVAQSVQGRAFIDRLAALTGADVSASVDTTGSASKGADWELEYSSGSVQAMSVIDQRVLDAFGETLITGWTPHGQGDFINSDKANNDEFGWAVAAADTTGWVVVGGYAQGDVYAYRPTGAGEYLEYKISPPSVGTAGVSVDVDGNFLIIGYQNLNKVYIYGWDSVSDTWTLRANVDGAGGFGKDVGIQADGTLYRAVVGAPTATTPGGGGVAAGAAVLLYSTDAGATWIQPATYAQTGTTTITVTQTGHGFVTGQQVYLDFTTGTAANAADKYYTVTVTGANTFTVVDVARTTSGVVRAYAALSTNDGAYDTELAFGSSVGIDGNNIVIGAPGWGYSTFVSNYYVGSTGSNSANHYVGRAYVYDWTGAATAPIQDQGVDSYRNIDGLNGAVSDVYSAAANFNGDGGGANAYFGFDVDISVNGTTRLIAVGAPSEAGNGEAYTWLNTVGAGNNWGSRQNIVPGLAAGSNFGYSVAIDAYSGRFAGGAWSFDNSGISGTQDGRVMLWQTYTGWAADYTWESSLGDSRFGWSVALVRDLVVSGSPWADVGSGSTNTGLMNLLIRNSTPVANVDASAVNENAVLTLVNVLANDTDPNFAGTGGSVATATGGVDVPKIIAISAPPTLGSASITTNTLGYTRLQFDANTGEFDYLRAGQTSIQTVGYTTTDGGGELSSANWTVTVNGVNDAVAIGTAIDPQVGNALQTVTLFTAANPISSQTLAQLGAFTDLDVGDTYTYKFANGGTGLAGPIVITPQSGNVAYNLSFSINAATGAITFAPTLAMVGQVYNIPGIYVSDGSTSVDLAPFTVTVARPNTVPTATGGTQAVTAWEDNYKPGTYSQSGTTITVTSTAHGLQIGDSVVLDFVTTPTSTAVDTSLVITGVTANTFTVTDTVSRTTSGAVLHSAVSDYDMSVHFSDVDFPTEAFSYTLIGAPTWVAIGIESGSLQFFGTNDDISAAASTFTVRATDQYGLYAEKTVSLTLMAVNDAPAVTGETPEAQAYLGQTYANTAAGALLQVPISYGATFSQTANTITITASATAVASLAVGSTVSIDFTTGSGLTVDNTFTVATIISATQFTVVDPDNSVSDSGNAIMVTGSTTLPLFTDIDRLTADTFTLSASYLDANGVEWALGTGAYPWLRFDATYGRFYTSGAVAGELGTVLNVKLRATDNGASNPAANGSPNLFTDYYIDLPIFPAPQPGTQTGYGSGNNQTGYAVAVSEDGLWMAVGEPQYDGTGNDMYRGQVSVYNWNGTAWAFVQTLAATTPANSARFGFSLDWNYDATRLVVGAPGETETVTGATYTRPTIAGTYTLSNPANVAGGYVAGNGVINIVTNSAHNLYVGAQVTLTYSGGGLNGTTVNYVVNDVISATEYTVASGAAPTTGNVTQKVTNVTVNVTGHGLGRYDSVYEDFTSGTGADGLFTVGSIVNANQYTFTAYQLGTLTNGNTTQSSGVVRVTAPTAHGLVAGDVVNLDFTTGTAVDGRYTVTNIVSSTVYEVLTAAAATTSGNASIILDDAGAAYSYTRTGGTTTFSAATRYAATAFGATAGDLFGYAVAINRAGDKFVVGAPGDDQWGSDAGAVYMYDFANTTQLVKRSPVADAGETLGSLYQDHFGYSLDFDGNVVIVGAPFDSSNGLFFNGSATVLGVTPGAGNNFNGAVLKGTGAASSDYYGWDVALDVYRLSTGVGVNTSITIAVGAPGSDTLYADAGAVYAYRSNAMTDTASQANLNTIAALSIVKLDASVVNPTGVFTAYDGKRNDRFGLSVAVDAQNLNLASATTNNDVADNGIRMAVGSAVDGLGLGAAYLFRDWHSVAGNGWVGQRYTQPTPSGYTTTNAGNQFGFAVATSNYASSAWNAAYTVTANAGKIAMGAPGTDVLRAATYGRATSTITVTLANHGLAVGQLIYIDFTSGGAVDQYYRIATVPTANTFTVTDTSSGTITAGATMVLSTTGMNGAVSSSTSATKAMESAPTAKSSVIDKWLDDSTAPVQQDAAARTVGLWSVKSSPIVYSTSSDTTADAPVATQFIAEDAGADPLLLLLQTSMPAADAVVQSVDEGELTLADSNRQQSPALVRQLQALGDRHQRAASDFVQRLAKMTA